MNIIKRHTEESYKFHDKNGLDNGLYDCICEKTVTFLRFFKVRRSYNRKAELVDSNIKSKTGFK